MDGAVAFTESYKRAFPQDIVDRYDWAETHSAAMVLNATNPAEFDNLVAVLRAFRLTMSKIARPGGNKSVIAQELDESFRLLGWREAAYEQHIQTRLVVNPWPPAGETVQKVRPGKADTSGHQVDNVKGRVGLDVEWNPKDGNLDRDLANFRSLYIVGQLDVGVIITRNQDRLRPLFKQVIAGAKAEAHTISSDAARESVQKVVDDPLSTTTTANMTNLEKKMARGDDGGCPILAIAITERCYQQPASVADAFNGTNVGTRRQDAGTALGTLDDGDGT